MKGLHKEGEGMDSGHGGVAEPVWVIRADTHTKAAAQTGSVSEWRRGGRQGWRRAGGRVNWRGRQTEHRADRPSGPSQPFRLIAALFLTRLRTAKVKASEGVSGHRCAQRRCAIQDTCKQTIGNAYRGRTMFIQTTNNTSPQCLYLIIKG